MLVDTLGLLLAVCVTTANTPERAGARQLLALRWCGRLRPPVVQQRLLRTGVCRLGAKPSGANSRWKCPAPEGTAWFCGLAQSPRSTIQLGLDFVIAHQPALLHWPNCSDFSIFQTGLSGFSNCGCPVLFGKETFVDIEIIVEKTEAFQQWTQQFYGFLAA